MCVCVGGGGGGLVLVLLCIINPFKPNGLSRFYQMDQSISVLIGIFHLYSNFKANSGDPDQTPRSMTSDLGLQCSPMSHKKDARLIWVNPFKPNGISHFYQLDESISV